MTEGHKAEGAVPGSAGNEGRWTRLHVSAQCSSRESSGRAFQWVALHNGPQELTSIVIDLGPGELNGRIDLTVRFSGSARGAPAVEKTEVGVAVINGLGALHCHYDQGFCAARFSLADIVAAKFHPHRYH